MKPYFVRAVASAAFASVFNTHAGPAPDNGAAEIERSLAKISADATSAFFDGAHSSDFSHLMPSPKEPKGIKLTLTLNLGSSSDKPSEAPKFSEDYKYELGHLAKICTPLDTENHTGFDTLAWSQKYVVTSDLPTFRRDFIEALYFTIARQPDSPEKHEAITKLNHVLPDSPAMLDYLDKKRNLLQGLLEKDEFLALINPKKNWKNLSDTNKEVVLDYISRLTLHTLLPGKNITHPRTFLLPTDILGGVDGLYSPNYHEIYTDIEHAEDYASAVKTTIHEAMHAFQSMIAKWYIEGEIGDNSQLKRQAKLYYIDLIKDGSGVAHHQNYTGYRLGVTERHAWAFQLAGSDQKLSAFDADTFMNLNQLPYTKYADPPVYRRDKTEGRLPAACLE